MPAARESRISIWQSGWGDDKAQLREMWCERVWRKDWLSKYIFSWGTCDDFCKRVLNFFVDNFPNVFKKIQLWTSSKNKWMRRASSVSFIPSLPLLELQNTISYYKTVWYRNCNIHYQSIWFVPGLKRHGYHGCIILILSILIHHVFFEN